YHAIQHGLRLVEEGAEILDIGGESTRPGAEAVSEADELARVLPVLEGLLADGRFARTGSQGPWISIDTMKPGVAARCLEAGATIVNDVSGLRQAEMRAVVAEHRASAVLMHMQGMPRTMQQDPRYQDVVREVRHALGEALALAREAGIQDVAVDPGIGFGKTATHNFQLLARMEAFLDLGAPLLAGPSRKSFLGTLEGMDAPAQRLEGTIAACVVCAMHGASVLRVHDVAACKRALRVVDAVRNAIS
ncbi:MAG: dihydropteroate synthase, partial [Bryobacterales bacterium]|nr:dihydropteroate synthase [Bryobacterales bacterium]